MFGVGKEAVRSLCRNIGRQYQGQERENINYGQLLGFLTEFCIVFHILFFFFLIFIISTRRTISQLLTRLGQGFRSSS